MTTDNFATKPSILNNPNRIGATRKPVTQATCSHGVPLSKACGTCPNGTRC